MSTVIKPEYKRTEVGIIPNDWKVVSLGEIGSCLIGLTYSPNNVKNHGTLVLRSSNIQNGTLTFEDNVYVDSEIPERIVVQEGDILICVRNGSRRLIGKCALLDQRVAGQTFGAFMSVFRTPDSAFVFHQFQSSLIKRQIDENIGATINQITNANLNAFKIPFPTDPQERITIARAMSDIDTLINSLDQLITKKRDIQQATMQQLLTGQHRLLGFSEKWEVRFLGDVCKITTGKKDVNEGNPSGQYPFFTCAREHTYSDLYSFDCEAILIAGNGEVGNLNYYFGKFEAYQRTYVLYGFDANTSYIWHALKFGLAASLGIGKIGSSIPYIKKSDLTNFELPLPTPEEQAVIAETISDMNAEIKKLEVRREKLSQIKQGMMQVLLTGTIRLTS